MNLPNKLTIFRMLLIPLIMITYAIESWRTTTIFYGTLTIANLIILILIFIGSMTDFLDGKIARKYNLVTTFGKFLDPIADKLLVITCMVILVDECKTYGNSLFTWWMLAIILAREFMVSGVRLVAAGKENVISASIWGKLKTTIQFITLIYLFAGVAFNENSLKDAQWIYYILGLLLVFATLVATIFSGIDYIVKYKNVLLDKDQPQEKKPKQTSIYHKKDKKNNETKKG